MTASSDPYQMIIESFLSTFLAEGKTVVSYTLENNILKDGLNFCTGISKLEVKYKFNEEIITKTFLLKVPCVSAFYEKLLELNMYQNECLFYSTILPEMSKIYETNLMPKIHHFAVSQTLIMEDLSGSGYRMVNKMDQLDFDHSIMALKALAKFHALSLKLDEVNKSVMELIIIPPRNDVKSETTHALFDKFNNTVELLNIPRELKLKIQNFQFQYLPQAFNETMVPSDGLNVLCHGDFWLGNLLYKYEDSKPVDVKMLDFQMIHKCSPVIDLIEFFVTSVRYDVFEEKEVTLIEEYLRSLNEILDMLNSDTRYTKEQLLEDMKKYKSFYIYNMGAYLPAVLNDNEDPFNHSGRETQVYTSNLYLTALTKWIPYIEKENFI